MFGREGCDPSTFFHYLRQPPAWGLSLWQHSTKAKERHPELHASRSTEARRTQVADATFRDKWRPKALSLTRTGGEIWRSCKQRRNDLEFLHATRAAMGTISNCQGFNTKQIAQNGLETKVKPTPLNRFDKLFASGFHFPCLTLRPLSFKGVVNIPTPIEVVTFTAPVLSALVNCPIPKTKGQIKQRKNFWTRRHRPQCFFFTGRLRPLFGYECQSWKARCPNLFGQLRHCDPYPYRGGGRGGQNQAVEFHFFLIGNPGIVIQPLEWNCKVTFLNKPWALVRKYLRLAPEELSASMITAAQIFGGMPSKTYVLLQSDMCVAPPELSASI